MAILIWAGLLDRAPQTVSGLVGLAPQVAAPAPAAARRMPVCGSGRRIDCVVDGDTLWIAGEKIRIATIDAPETAGRCARETELARRATLRLSELVSSRDLVVERQGLDRYGRTLARIRTRSGDVGEVLVREGLAQPWAGRRAQWCTA